MGAFDGFSVDVAPGVKEIILGEQKEIHKDVRTGIKSGDHVATEGLKQAGSTARSAVSSLTGPLYVAAGVLALGGLAVGVYYLTRSNR